MIPGPFTYHRPSRLTEAVALLATLGEEARPLAGGQGTFGGNVANGDPANDTPALMQALDAAYVLRGTGGARRRPRLPLRRL